MRGKTDIVLQITNFFPFVSGNVHIQAPVSRANNAARKIPPERPYDCAITAIATGVKN